MRGLIIAALCAGTIAVSSGAEAKGCIRGAILGGIAGHFAGHHGLVGAAAGCAVGHHVANRQPKAAPGQYADPNH